MDWSMFQPLFVSLASVAITAGVGIGSTLLYRYTGVKISAANEDAIRNAATTEAGKLLTLGSPITPQAAATAAVKVLTDLPNQVKAENYNHNDITDMILGAASTNTPPPSPMVNGKPPS
jgi:hypothetical protein